ncbi:hypothetical protein ACFPYJ_32385 [Paenibacillus solisilvae]|uniref:Uncharacterized protein n=1 Tax=Paenibacillus solisilvae TaxID=2486751 RepID=A0ABW0WB40_9BACL
MKKIFCLALIVVTSMSILTCSMVFADMENPLAKKRQSFEAPFLGLAESKIESAKISAHSLRRPLKSGEIKSFVSLINQVDKDDISEYKDLLQKEAQYVLLYS